jgi:hypothetical protein
LTVGELRAALEGVDDDLQVRFIDRLPTDIGAVEVGMCTVDGWPPSKGYKTKHKACWLYSYRKTREIENNKKIVKLF